MLGALDEAGASGPQGPACRRALHPAGVRALPYCRLALAALGRDQRLAAGAVRRVPWRVRAGTGCGDLRGNRELRLKGSGTLRPLSYSLESTGPCRAKSSRRRLRHRGSICALVAT